MQLLIEFFMIIKHEVCFFPSRAYRTGLWPITQNINGTYYGMKSIVILLNSSMLKTSS